MTTTELKGPMPGRWRLALVGAALLIVFVLALGSVYVATRDEPLREWTSRLSSAADDRAASLQRWLDDLRADAAHYASFPSVVTVLGGARRTPLWFREEADRGVHLRGVLAATLGHPGRAEVWVFDADGEVVASARDGRPNPEVAAMARPGTPDDAPLVHAYALEGATRVAVGSPVLDRGRVLGFVVVEEDARDFLFPMLLSQADRSGTAEALLVVGDGQAVRFLSPLRKLVAGPDLRVPLATQDLAATAALRGDDGVGAFTDYQGDRVLAATRAIAGAPWGLVVKADRREVFAAHRRKILLLGLAFTGILLGGLGFAYGLWKRDAAAAQRRVREREELFRWHAERAGDLIYRIRLRPDRAFEFVNRASTTLTGYTPEDHYADPDLGIQIVHPEDRAAVEAAIRDPDTQDGKPFVMRWVRKDGGIIWIEQRNVLIRDEAGAVVAVEGIAREVTGTKQVEHQLMETRDRLQLALSVAHQTLFDADMRTSSVLVSTSRPGNGGVRARNRVLTFVEAQGALHPEDRQRVAGLFADLSTGSTDSLRDEFRIRDPGAGFRWVQATARAVERDDAGQALRVVGLYADVTARRLAEAGLQESREKYTALEEQMRHAQKMEAVGRLAGGIAHDFNNVLTAIRGNALIALEDLPPGWPAREDIEQVVRDADRAAALTRQLLSFSRKHVMQLRVFDLCSVATGMEPLIRRLIGEDILLLFEGDGPCWIQGDPAQLEQVILNLAVNARDAMPDGGRLTISSTPARGRDDAPEVVLRVRDNGTGMDATTIDSIFEPFFTTKEDGKGTGLGLSTAYGIVHQCGGDIRVDSAIGVGTTFTLVFPAAVAPPEVEPAAKDGMAGATRPMPPADPSDEADPRPRILIVEDEPAVMALARRVLERDGFEVLTADSTEGALAVAAAHSSIRVLITDTVLPGIAGPDLAARLAETQPDLAIILMSGYPEAVVRERHTLPAEVPFLEKPFTPAQLLACVVEALTPAASVAA